MTLSAWNGVFARQVELFCAFDDLKKTRSYNGYKNLRITKKHGSVFVIATPLVIEFRKFVIEFVITKKHANHAANRSWVYVDRSDVPTGRSL
eukprot:357559-Pleurochrysis_carterae.AAC.2